MSMEKELTMFRPIRIRGGSAIFCPYCWRTRSANPAACALSSMVFDMSQVPQSCGHTKGGSKFARVIEDFVLGNFSIAQLEPLSHGKR